MRSTRLFKSMFCLMAAGILALNGCKSASYEIIKGKKNKKVEDSGNPNTIANPTPPGEGEKKDGKEKPGTPSINIPPTARVEVILNKISVTKIKVNEAVRIGPSFDTVDPDDLGKSKCANPGIVSASYNIDTLASPSAARKTDGCEDLSVPYIFTKAGSYVISMVVLSNEKEKAAASMILVVSDPSVPDASNDGGFKIKADPMLAGKGQQITFTGYCNTSTENTISWDFGDGTTASGKTVTHSYKKNGQYRVEATCTDGKGVVRKSVITIVVIDKAVVIPGSDQKPEDEKPVDSVVTPEPDPNDSKPDPVTPDPNDPGDGQCDCECCPQGWWWY